MSNIALCVNATDSILRKGTGVKDVVAGTSHHHHKSNQVA